MHHPVARTPPPERATHKEHLMTTQTIDIDVQGMTCAHCVRSVTEQLGAVPGVTDVAIDLVSGGTSRVRITAAGPLSDDAIAAAVEEAGYAIAPPRSLL
jgi:copper chaperone